MVGRPCPSESQVIRMSLKTAIIIPARYGSTRFPGKPLAQLAGRSVLAHVYELSKQAALGTDTSVHITTDDDRIEAEALQLGASVLRTTADCKTGTDRVMQAASLLDVRPDFVINMQGDAPLTPPDFLSAIISAAETNDADIVTPVTQLSWGELDTLRQSKTGTPFSGTTATLTAEGKALWFSKNIIPAIRKEAEMRTASPLSPVFRHIGLYGYRLSSLERYAALPVGVYEELEGLEQLRALENGMTIQCVRVDYKGRPAMTGIDSPEDLARAERLLNAS